MYVLRTEYLNKLMRFRDRTDIVKVITGVRRCGKSTLLMQFKDLLIAEGVNAEDIIYLNFESFQNEKFLNRRTLTEHLLNIGNGRRYLLLDEIQRVDEWELMINSILVDMDADVYITGSNAYFLSTDLSTYLTGRSVAIDMLPLSFGEFAKLNGNDDIVEYLNMGGMPMIRKDMRYEDAQDILNNINSTILLNDVVARNNIRDVSSMTKILEYVYSEIGNLISPSSIAKHLSINDKTVDNHLRLLEESLLIIKVPRYDMKGHNILKGSYKYYATDTGMRNAFLRSRDRDIGRLVENAVFLELKRRNYRVTVGKYDDMEIDFTASKGQVTEYFQVAKTVVDDDVLKREMRPLEDLKDNYSKTVITMDVPPQHNINGIRFVKLVDFLKPDL